MSQPDYPRLDFIKRTMTNLRFIEAVQRDRVNGPFEVTQLVNSFLMAFIHPREYWIEQIDDKAPLPALGWPDVFTEATYKGNQFEPKNLRSLVMHIRDALAHGNFDILPNNPHLPDDQRNIASIRLWTTVHPKTTERSWETTIAVEGLRQILTAFVPLALELATANYDEVAAEETRPRNRKGLGSGMSAADSQEKSLPTPQTSVSNRNSRGEAAAEALCENPVKLQ